MNIKTLKHKLDIYKSSLVSNIPGREEPVEVIRNEDSIMVLTRTIAEYLIEQHDADIVESRESEETKAGIDYASERECFAAVVEDNVKLKETVELLEKRNEALIRAIGLMTEKE